MNYDYVTRDDCPFCGADLEGDTPLITHTVYHCPEIGEGEADN